MNKGKVIVYAVIPKNDPDKRGVAILNVSPGTPDETVQQAEQSLIESGGFMSVERVKEFDFLAGHGAVGTAAELGLPEEVRNEILQAIQQKAEDGLPVGVPVGAVGTA